MILRNLFNYILFLAVIFSFGCSRDERLSEEVGEASLVIHIDQEKATGTKSVLDDTYDRTINTLSVWLVDMSDNIQRTSFTSPESATATVEFTNVERGEHKLYIVANYTGLNSISSGKIDDSFKNTVLSVIASGNSPVFTSSQGIPSSIVQDVAISAGINDIQAHLIRAVARLSITFRNLVPDKDLFIGNIMLSKRNQSKGYLFPKDDHSNPTGSENLNFPDLGSTEIKKIPANGNVVVYDTYLYETTPELSDFFVQFSGGMYAAGSATPGYTNSSLSLSAHTVGTKTNDYDNSSTYLLQSYYSPTKFLGVNSAGNALEIKTYDNDEQIKSDSDIDRYLWKIDKDGYIQNVETNNYLYLYYSTVGLVGNIYKTKFNINKENGCIFLYYDNYYFNIKSDASSVEGNYYYYDTDRKLWYLRKVTKGSSSVNYKKFTSPDVELSYSNVYPVNYIDKYGLPQPLQHICRNEHIDLTVNVSHNTATGNFDFKVAGWVIKDNLNTEFN